MRAKRADFFFRVKPRSLRNLEHDGDTFDHEGPLIINGAQISSVQVARRVQNFLFYSIYRFILKKE